MIAAVLSTLAVAVVSAFLPVVPIEPYLLGAVAATGHGAVVLGLAAGVGQTAGKVAMFAAARGTLRSARLRRWLNRRGLTSAGTPGETGTPPRAPDDPAGTSDDPSGTPGTPSAVRQSVDAPPPLAADRPGGRWRQWQRWRDALARAMTRPALTGPVLLLSALIGMPPLLVLVVYVATATRMRLALFTVLCLVGRCTRFVLLAAGLHALLPN